MTANSAFLRKFPSLSPSSFCDYSSSPENPAFNPFPRTTGSEHTGTVLLSPSREGKGALIAANTRVLPLPPADPPNPGATAPPSPPAQPSHTASPTTGTRRPERPRPAPPRLSEAAFLRFFRALPQSAPAEPPGSCPAADPARTRVRAGAAENGPGRVAAARGGGGTSPRPLASAARAAPSPRYVPPPRCRHGNGGSRRRRGRERGDPRDPPENGAGGGGERERGRGTLNAPRGPGAQPRSAGRASAP